jgi:hypothetical protein
MVTMMGMYGMIKKYLKNKKEFRRYWKFQRYIKSKMGHYIFEIDGTKLRCGNPYDPFRFFLNLEDPQTIESLNALLKGDYEESLL